MKGLIGTDTQHSFPLTEFLLKPKLKLCKTKLTEPACAHNGLIIGRRIPQLCNAASSPIPEKQQTPVLYTAAVPRDAGRWQNNVTLFWDATRTFLAIPAPLQDGRRSSFCKETCPVSDPLARSSF